MPRQTAAPVARIRGMGFTRYYSRDHNRRSGTSVLMQQYNSGRDRSYVSICFDPGSAGGTWLKECHANPLSYLSPRIHGILLQKKHVRGNFNIVK